MSDAYRTYSDLATTQVEGRDYEIENRAGHTGVLFMAPHGGGIELGTAPLAKAAAGDAHAYYCFKGIKKGRGNWCLHITSTRFDEPRAIEAVKKANHVVAIHGAHERDGCWVMVGGLDENLVHEITSELIAADFDVRPCDIRRAAQSPDNICNKGMNNAGVQLELSRPLRDHLKKDREAQGRFVDALRAAVPQERTDDE